LTQAKVVAFLYSEEGEELDQLEERLKKHIVIKATEGLDHERYKRAARRDLSRSKSTL